MPETETEYRQKFTEIHEIPAPDELINAPFTASTLRLTAPGIVRRGTLLMSSGNNEFTPATSAGVSSAYELAVLCNDIDTEGETAVTSGYFSGVLNSGALILSWETEADSHEEQIDSILPALRRSGFYLQ